MLQLVLAAPRSGSGKTTAACALLAALTARGLTPCAFKSGPDYIDPMFHRAVLGVESHNLDLFFSALMNMFENDRSAARGLMSSRKLFVFKHESKLGNAPAHRLFEAVKVNRLIPDAQEARSFSDYAIEVGDIPEGVELIELF